MHQVIDSMSSQSEWGIGSIALQSLRPCYTTDAPEYPTAETLGPKLTCFFSPQLGCEGINPR